ncbi:1-acyl-sn-glycerol-3-phosphate acyltransferase [Spirochaeta africana]|uniref:Phospholipid/glycerol acyltransferase domain-containing protein n=1 Tax=Spirochaeta africana (strain ATCC 700263 / DSM 8902 / Z-7692) TaxID=889378 RepID=H9UM01_SPIAZ|nr:1-acyl-sn-glycerol-3-phosphate acyltransferase [Spirochaeta africana]AFG38544.1 hypothetical protein Spiaf_2514 [Spirochaeta africana DSM 8902]
MRRTATVFTGLVGRFLKTWGINIAETYQFLQINSWVLRGMIAPIAVVSSLRLTVQLYLLDRRAARSGFRTAMLWVLQRYYRASIGACPPAELMTGPLLVVANHPGLGDFLALLECLPREDVRVIVKQRELLADKPHILSSCIVITESTASKAAALQEGIRHLQQGGMLVVFPAGEIEDDPRSPAAAQPDSSCLKPWMPVVDSIARRCRRDSIPLAVLPAAIDHVYHVPGVLHPWIAAAATPETRSGRAAIITMLLPRTPHKRIRVRFLHAVYPATPGGQLTEDIRSRIEAVLSDHTPQSVATPYNM